MMYQIYRLAFGRFMAKLGKKKIFGNLEFERFVDFVTQIREGICPNVKTASEEVVNKSISPPQTLLPGVPFEDFEVVAPCNASPSLLQRQLQL